MTADDVKHGIGRGLYYCAMLLLIGYVVVVIVAFAIAAHDGRIPKGWWVRDTENHGPWRHYEPVTTLFKCALASVLCGALMTETSTRLTESKRSVVTLVIALVLIVFHLVFLMWLTQ